MAASAGPDDGAISAGSIAVIVFVLHLAGAVALLIWAVRMIRTGVERAFLTHLRSLVRRAGSGPAGMAGGAAAAIMLQSSTAVAVLAAAFAASGVLAPMQGLAVLLGADLGSAVVALVLLSPIGALVPLLLIVGVGLFQKAARPEWRQAGRILIGLALVFVSLDMIRAASAPVAQSPFAAMAVSYLSRDLVSAFAIGAVLAWAMHSSVAAVLTFVTFAAEGLLPVAPAAALVLGANLGGAAIPVVLTLSGAEVARRMVVANLMLRGGGALLVLAALVFRPGAFDWTDLPPAAQVIALHILFNLAVALAGLTLRRPALAFASRVVPDRAALSGQRISALDPAAFDDTNQALACATRELLRMAERIHGMLLPVMGLCRNWSPETAAAIVDGENDVDRMHFEIKLYVARLQEAALTSEQSRRAMDIASIANNLEDAGDQVSNHLVAIARRMQAKGLSFSKDGWDDLETFHDRVASNAQLALNLMLTSDVETARQLVEEKDRVRRSEQAFQERHLERLRQGNPATLETSNLHQEALRALKQINTDFSLIAYPIVEAAGELRASRLAAASARAG